MRITIKFFAVLAVMALTLLGCAQVAPATNLPSTTSTNAAGATPHQPPKTSYAQRIQAAIAPHIVLAEPIDGNPAAEVRVTIQADGKVINAELVKSSGYAHWDQSVRRAVLKAGWIPADIDGIVPSELFIRFRPYP
jgi:TonB family protein